MYEPDLDLIDACILFYHACALIAVHKREISCGACMISKETVFIVSARVGHVNSTFWNQFPCSNQ